MGDNEIAAGQACADGGFALAVLLPTAKEVSIIVDTREGRVANVRFGPEQVGGGAGATPGETAPASLPADMAVSVASPVEAAIERQMTPLLERADEMDSRRRLSDLISSLFLVFGMVGMGFWVLERRK